MADVSVGLVTAAEVNGPMAVPNMKWGDMGSPATWATIWFALAIVLLLFFL